MFKYQPNRDYFFIPTHSGQPIGVHYNSTLNNALLEQQQLNVESLTQRIRFQHVGFNEYNLIIRLSGKSVTVPNLSRDLHTQIIQWDTNNDPQQRWRLVHYGNGAYHILSTFNGLALEIPGATGGPAAFQQNKLQVGAAHQLFQIVPVPERGLPANTTPFQSYTNMGRMLVMGLAGAIPKIGGGISALIGLLWPSDHDQRFWQQMKDYVDVRMTEMLEHQRLIRLEGEIAGLVKNMRIANDPELAADDHWSHLVSVTTQATGIEHDFLTTAHDDSYRILSHLAAWGTLVLGANAQMYRNYEALHPTKTKAQCEKDKQPYKKVLLENLKTYTDAVATCRTEALKWRLGKIGVRVFPYPFSPMSWIVIVTDSLTGWEQLFMLVGGQPDQANEWLEARRAHIKAQFEAEMDAVLSPARLWRFLDPAVTERPASETVRRVVGPLFRLQNITPPEEVPGTITSISLGVSGGILSGVVVYYSDGRKRVTGTEQPNMSTLNLEPGEYIANAYGRNQNSIKQGAGLITTLNFETNFGRVLTTGPSEGNEFWAGLDDNLQARLTGLSNGNGGLCFHWEYSWQYDWKNEKPLSEHALAELIHPSLTLFLAQEAETEANHAAPVQDFTTREFAAGQW